MSVSPDSRSAQQSPLGAAPAEAPGSPPAQEEMSTDWAALGRILQPVRSQMILAFALVFVSSAIRLLPVVAISEIALHYGELSTRGVYGWVIAAAVGLVLGQLVYMMVTGWCHRIEAQFRGALRARVIRHLSRVPLGWFSSTNSGTVKKTVSEDVATLHAIVAHSPSDAASALALPVTSIVLLFWYDWRFAIGILLWLVLVLGVFKLLSSSSMREATEQYMTAQSRMSQALIELVQGIAVVKNFGATSSTGVFSRYESTLKHFLTWTRRWMLTTGRPQSTMLALFFPTGMLAPVVGLAWALSAWGGNEPTRLVPLIVIGLGLTTGIITLVPLAGLIAQGGEAAKRLDEVLQSPILEVSDTPVALPDGPLDIRFENVTFGYRPEHPVIRDLSVEIPAGSVTALVGPSGSGKSTLTRLVARFYDPQQGRVLLGGVDVREADDTDVLAHLAIVEQSIGVIHGTARENIALGLPDASEADIIRAAQAARIHERILALPEGYDTMLGEGGAYLSGGERQRITLARAFLRDAPVLLLDEATAYADPHSERDIQLALADLARGRTVLVIAHRLSTVTGVDRILVIDDGRIAESGTHDELLAAGGLYSTLWEAQQ